MGKKKNIENLKKKTMPAIADNDVIEEVKKAIEGVKTDLSELVVNEEKTIGESAMLPTADVNEITALEKELETSKEKFNSMVENTKDDGKLALIIEEEIDKANEVKKGAENILNRNTKMTNAEITYFWNGINYGE